MRSASGALASSRALGVFRVSWSECVVLAIGLGSAITLPLVVLLWLAVPSSAAAAQVALALSLATFGLMLFSCALARYFISVRVHEDGLRIVARYFEWSDLESVVPRFLEVQLTTRSGRRAALPASVARRAEFVRLVSAHAGADSRFARELHAFAGTG